MKQSEEILLVVGLVPCCQDPSSNLGETIFTGTYTPQGFIDGNPLMTYQNFTLIVPPNLGGGVGIQVMRVALGDSPVSCCSSGTIAHSTEVKRSL